MSLVCLFGWYPGWLTITIIIITYPVWLVSGMVDNPLDVEDLLGLGGVAQYLHSTLNIMIITIIIITIITC